MKFIKMWCHFKANIKKITYKLIYGKKLKIGKGTTWRNEFHVAIENGGTVEIGENCFFNNGCSLNALEFIKIGDGPQSCGERRGTVHKKSGLYL